MKPFTVIFYIDGEYSVETFVQRVHAESSIAAWDIAVKEAKKEGATSSGRPLHSYEWNDATEIVTFDGHIAYSKC